MNGKIKLIEKQRRVQSQLNAFKHTAAGFWVNVEPDDSSFQNQATQDADDEDVVGDTLLNEVSIGNSRVGLYDQEDDDSSYEDNDDSDEDLSALDSIRLHMPSALGSAWCRRQGLMSLMEQEVGLREGQANDALRGIRLALAEVALLTRAQHRDLKSQKTNTRSFVQLKTVQGTLGRHVRAYRRAYQALLNMEADKESFQPLRKEDLKMSADVVEENRIGQKSDVLAWFWRIGGGQNEQTGSRIEECGSSILIMAYITDTCLDSLSGQLA
jgi:hypothetical protein